MLVVRERLHAHPVHTHTHTHTTLMTAPAPRWIFFKIHCWNNEAAFFGAFAMLRKATMSLVVSVCLSVGMDQIGSRWTDFHEIWYLSIFRKSCLENSSLIKIRKELRVLCMKTYIQFLSYLASSLLRKRNARDKSCRENPNTHFILSNFCFTKFVPFVR